jgi:hypothetical protein
VKWKLIKHLLRSIAANLLIFDWTSSGFLKEAFPKREQRMRKVLQAEES